MVSFFFFLPSDYYATVRSAMRCDATRRDETRRDETRRDSMGWDAMQCNTMQRNARTGTNLTQDEDDGDERASRRYEREKKKKKKTAARHRQTNRFPFVRRGVIGEKTPGAARTDRYLRQVERTMRRRRRRRRRRRPWMRIRENGTGQDRWEGLECVVFFFFLPIIFFVCCARVRHETRRHGHLPSPCSRLGRISHELGGLVDRGHVVYFFFFYC